MRQVKVSISESHTSYRSLVIPKLQRFVLRTRPFPHFLRAATSSNHVTCALKPRFSQKLYMAVRHSDAESGVESSERNLFNWLWSKVRLSERKPA